MQFLGISFSARVDGNCCRILDHCLAQAGSRGFDPKFIHAGGKNILPCRQCAYECFADRDCPLADDVPSLYLEWQKSARAVFVVPTYGGHACSVFLAFLERAQGIIREYVNWDSLLARTHLVIIGNAGSGGELACQEALAGWSSRGVLPETLFLSPREYGQRSTAGTLTESQEVKDRLERFIQRVIWYSETP